ncbi:hypothetical protein B0H16DRAFT_1506086 [Mycena metata]|uniref:Uncharacterized protein n=1 Tax=Mycena metata TaxID=1033252 RepID=A0AAD7NV39_9AGAR|nr:hypothetical protein B0H16DRAFT_1621632 [Mycena metata]KAJ7776264.1 hypothetical protein B0H16DRAFT_1506086 [Mycena metata]
MWCIFRCGIPSLPCFSPHLSVMLLLSIEKICIASLACEALCYGFFLCIFIVAVYAHLKVSRRTTNTTILFAISCAMFIVATWHFGITVYRIVYGLADIDTQENRASAAFIAIPSAIASAISYSQTGFLANPHSWHALMRDALYIAQCILGDSVAIYRCWILWDRDFRVIAVPLILLVGTIVSGAMVCQRLSTLASYSTIFDPAVWDWLVAFYSLGLGQNTMTTGLMASRLWLVGRRSQAYNIRGRSPFFSTMRLLVESAALYFALQISVLVVFLVKSNIQLVLLGSIPPVIGVTFTVIIIRVAFRSRPRAEGSVPTQTAGSLNLRDLGITIEISEEVIAKHDSEDSPV